jgi:hypothetical protein
VGAFAVPPDVMWQCHCNACKTQIASGNLPATAAQHIPRYFLNEQQDFPLWVYDSTADNRLPKNTGRQNWLKLFKNSQ